ncbi:hypothetical protein AtubIFM55763_001444 [Aspergillus tubingensis]|uniref:Uncharacterized protein n=2 Tax=Aspergillus subgen. Circumdati TaxID=2720871 RepID=A0A100IFW7_ASPNG|nr:hypothetical protein AKAW_08539 [Aspergillus niger]GLA67647.1 hypothetical protein AtubIFM54640_011640 [Aspergillus tubingensis]GLA79030.1 hypothetical protein AtubIFM55763_001444 [Aspergillus tubingensis]GLA86359.1 hypothetical protein AtubIFM56815_010621 [Aspergillus tubingensis]
MMKILKISLTLFLALTAAALAAPSPYTQEHKYARVTLQQQKITSEKQILVKDSSTGDVLGTACSNALITRAFSDFGIVADVGPNGDGNITAGPSTFVVHEDPQYSGGITCYRMYNDYESFVVCDGVPLPTNVPLDPIKGNDIPPCFSDTVDMTLQRAAETIHVVDTFPVPGSETNSTSAVSTSNLEQRQTGTCSQWSPATRKVGDGDPHQNYWRKQLSENLDCGNADHCTVGATQSKSYTIGWTATADASQWISGGFAVQASWTTGLDYQCTASSHQTVCIWYNTAHTAYTVQNGLYNVCTGFNPNNGAGFVMFSPNQNNKGGGYYCVIGTCRSQGQNYWDKSGPAGGP